MCKSTQRNIEWADKSTQQHIESEVDIIPDRPYVGQLRGVPDRSVGQLKGAPDRSVDQNY